MNAISIAFNAKFLFTHDQTKFNNEKLFIASIIIKMLLTIELLKVG